MSADALATGLYHYYLKSLNAIQRGDSELPAEPLLNELKKPDAVVEVVKEESVTLRGKAMERISSLINAFKKPDTSFEVIMTNHITAVDQAKMYGFETSQVVEMQILQSSLPERVPLVTMNQGTIYVGVDEYT